MIPIEDENPTYSRAWVVYALLVLNILVFWFEINLAVEGDVEAFVYSYGATPKEIASGQALHTIFTSMFLHVGLLHIAGNMLFLYIFGNNIEDVLGKKRFIFFYLISGVGASLFQVLIDPGSEIPMLGASGAIAGVLGAYFYIYPKANVKSVLLIGFPFNVFYHLYRGLARIPAYLLIGFWFLMQLFPGFMSLQYGFMGEIAYFAHIGGFLTGILLIKYISTDLDIARRKQQIYEGICALKSERMRKNPGKDECR
ncbi:MAG: rhomboid family intramembrane serine protease [Candidatus Altiarchaeota archaeon]|nr:rhomboid family intramembrane serine protease [Candidatus Altiarchaeota archaeon]